MNKLSEKILEKIKEENIKQKSKNFFIIKNLFNWGFTIFAILLSAFFISAIYFILVNKLIIPMMLFSSFVSFGLLFLLLASYLSYKRFKQIKNSYKYNLKYVFISFIVIVFVTGFVFARFRIYNSFDQIVSKSIPQLSANNRIHQLWSDPNNGRLAGEIIGISDDYILLEAFDGKVYFVDPAYLDDEDKDVFLDFLRVRMVGHQDNGIFYPLEVSKWSLFNTRRNMHKEYLMEFIDENINFRHGM